MNWNELKLAHRAIFGGEGTQFCFSAPGRTEIGGNHTDHQHGKVLAAAVDLDTRAVVSRNEDSMIRIQSKGYEYFEIALAALVPLEEEKGTSAALVRGVAARIRQLGHTITGFDAYIESDVLPGSGLSSSAAFEVLIGTVINHLDHCGLSAVEIAQIGQYAENVFFGKPSGLMDQTASSVGNIITIDFEDTNHPVVRSIEVDFSDFGHSLCIIDSGADHANLTDEYASIPGELKKLCACYGKNYVREIPEERFYSGLVEARKIAGDRAVLRAIHIYEDNKRVEQEVKALEEKDFGTFLKLVNASGKSSWMLLQNVTPTGYTDHQELAFSLALCEKILGGRGACRVHGGGFAGTIQAFVPNDMLSRFKNEMETYLGVGRCHVLNIRPQGGVREE